MKISARINGRVTSISLHDSMCAMHYLLTNDNQKLTIQDHMNDFVHRNILPKWQGDTAKGLSTLVTHMLILDCLDQEEHPTLNTLIKQMRVQE